MGSTIKKSLMWINNKRILAMWMHNKVDPQYDNTRILIMWIHNSRIFIVWIHNKGILILWIHDNIILAVWIHKQCGFSGSGEMLRIFVLCYELFRCVLLSCLSCFIVSFVVWLFVCYYYDYSYDSFSFCFLFFFCFYFFFCFSFFLFFYFL